MQSGVSFLHLHIAAPAQDLTVLGDQGSSNGNASFGDTLFRLLDGSDESRMLVHFSGWLSS